MKRVAMVWRVKADRVEEYAALHREAWPEIKALAQQVGMRNYSIFLHGNLGFAYLELEGDDFDEAMEQYRATDTWRRWQVVNGPLIEPEVEPGTGQLIAMLPEVYHND